MTTERKESKGKTYLVPVRQIVANTNPRYPLSDAIKKAGYCIFGDDKPSVWKLATSDFAEERAQFVQLIKQHDSELTALATTLLSEGQLQPVEVRDNGKRANHGGNTYTLVYGCRRCLAALFNWCVLGKPSEPLIEAKLVKGNEATLLHRAMIENVRKQPTLIEEAKAIKYALNNHEDEKEIAAALGYTEQTIRNRLALLELPPDTQAKIEQGKLSATKALEAKKDQQEVKKPRLRSRKLIEEAMLEFAEDRKEFKVLKWVLGEAEEF